MLAVNVLVELGIKIKLRVGAVSLPAVKITDAAGVASNTKKTPSKNSDKSPPPLRSHVKVTTDPFEVTLIA